MGNGSVFALSEGTLPAISLLSCHQNNLNIKLKPKFLREGRRGIWPQQLGLWCASPFFAPNSLPNINILPILNKYLSHEKTRNVLNPFGQHWGSGFPPNSNADFTADLFLLGETFTTSTTKKTFTTPTTSRLKSHNGEKYISSSLLEVWRSEK